MRNCIRPHTLHQAIADAVDLNLEPSLVTVTRRQRDPLFRLAVFKAYDSRCAVCGYDARIIDVTMGIDAAHIKWHTYGGPDNVSNGLALCSLHHVAFDYGAISLSEESRVLVSQNLRGQAELVKDAFHGQPLCLSQGAVILAISQAICLYREQKKIDGPLFLGMDTHALSVPALASALEVLAANGVEVMISQGDEYTPTPAISHAILTYNRGRKTGLADGIVITPSHNPPHDGGFKYNPPNGGPAESAVTTWIEVKANEFLKNDLQGLKRTSFEKALSASTTHRHDYLNAYIGDLGNVIDMDAIRGAKINVGVDPLGGAGVHYWGPIAERYGLDLTVVNEAVDPTFRFMTVDWDGQIRMDPSSPYAMQRLIDIKDRFEITWACDTDHDRHGIVTRSAGLLPPNHYLSVAIFYLFQHRPKWRKEAAVGKTVVSSQMIDRVAAKLGRKLYEVPVGFKWFVDGLLDGSLGFGGEESAGASFVRLDGSVWTTDKDGIVPALLAAEITARMGRDPGEIYRELTREFGEPVYDRVEAAATPEQKELLAKLSPQQVKIIELAGERIQTVLTNAPGNGAPIGGLKVIAESGWFAARPSGTEDIYKIYAESFRGAEHLRHILEEAQTIVNDAIAPAAASTTDLKGK